MKMIRNGAVISGLAANAADINYKDLYGNESSVKDQLDNINLAIGEGGIDSIREQNNGRPLKFWVGTCAEYAPLDNHPDPNTLYIKTDESLLMQDNIIVEEVFVEGVTPKNSFKAYTANIDKEGYVPISCTLISSNNPNDLPLGMGYRKTTTGKWEAYTQLRNISSTDIAHSVSSGSPVVFKVTYIKNNIYDNGVQKSKTDRTGELLNGKY